MCNFNIGFFFLLDYLLSNVNCADPDLLDMIVNEDILDFKGCPFVNGPQVNITHTKDYEEFTVCIRYMTTSYVPCPGETSYPIALTDWVESRVLILYLYQPISGMSEDGKHAAWVGFRFPDTSNGTSKQVFWHNVLFDEPLKILEWHSACFSFNKKTGRMLFYNNGVKYIDRNVTEKRIKIPPHYFSELSVLRSHRGAVSDLQVYSSSDEEILQKWTTCKYDNPGDVYQWDINKFNMSSVDPRMIIKTGKVDRKNFCKSLDKKTKIIHMFGQGSDISQIDGCKLCKRLNGKAFLLPPNEEGMLKLLNILQDYRNKTNSPQLASFVGGRTQLGEHLNALRWFPESTGIYDFEDPETGKLLITDENREIINRDDHTYQKLKDLCICIADAIKNFHIMWQKCTRKVIGRIFCEFDEHPNIKIKGLCDQSSIDRAYQLIDPTIGEGK